MTLTRCGLDWMTTIKGKLMTLFCIVLRCDDTVSPSLMLTMTLKLKDATLYDPEFNTNA